MVKLVDALYHRRRKKRVPRNWTWWKGEPMSSVQGVDQRILSIFSLSLEMLNSFGLVDMRTVAVRGLGEEDLQLKFATKRDSEWAELRVPGQLREVYSVTFLNLYTDTATAYEDDDKIEQADEFTHLLEQFAFGQFQEELWVSRSGTETPLRIIFTDTSEQISDDSYFASASSPLIRSIRRLGRGEKILRSRNV